MTFRRAGLAAALVLLLSGLVRAADGLPEGVDIVPVLGSRVPLDRPFVDERGRAVELREYFRPEKPVVLILAYYRCPMLCSVVLQLAADGLKQVDFEPGADFEVVVLSIDPTETAGLAKLNQQKFAERYGRADAAGMHFLTGKAKDVRAVANSVGFGYRWNEETEEFMHAAGLFILTPDGRLSQCITGLEYAPKTLRLSLVDASEGSLGSLLDRMILGCSVYDHEKGEYTPAVWMLARVVGAATLLMVAALVVPAWVRSARRRRNPNSTEAEETRIPPCLDS